MAPMGWIFASIETVPKIAFERRISSLFPSAAGVHISIRLAFLGLVSKEWEVGEKALTQARGIPHPGPKDSI